MAAGGTAEHGIHVANIVIDGLIEAGYMLVGTPDEVSEQIANWGDVGMDQLVFGLPIEGMYHEEVLACLELFGDKVIPEFDTDPEFYTSIITTRTYQDRLDTLASVRAADIKVE